MERRTALSLLASASLLANFRPGRLLAGDGVDSPWSQWRGPSRDGLTDMTWPSQLNENSLAKVWSVALSESYSGPVTDGEHVFTTESVADKGIERVIACRIDDGKIAWTSDWNGSMTVPFFAARNGSWIRSTPACADGKLLVGGMKDHLHCLSASTGERVWDINFPEQMGSSVPSFGFVCSPLIDGEYAFIQAGDGLVKLNVATGEIIWHTLKNGNGMMGSAFSSPVIVEIAGVRQLVVQTREALLGVDLETGNALWSQEIPAFRGMNILTPTVIGNSVFTSSYGGKAWLYEITNTGGTWSIQLKWENKVQAYMSSPVLVGDHFYLHLRNKRFTCINAITGETAWTTRPFGEYWSMIANDQQILALDQTGELRLINANPGSYEQVGEVKLCDQETWAHLALGPNGLLVRDLKGLTRYTWA